MKVYKKIWDFIESRGVSEEFADENSMTKSMNLAAFLTSLGCFILFLITLLTVRDPVYLSVAMGVSFVYTVIPILHHFHKVSWARYYFSTILPFWYTATILSIGGFWGQGVSTAAILMVTYVIFEKQKKIRFWLVLHNILLFALPSIYLGFYPPIFGVRDLPFDEILVLFICIGWISLVFKAHQEEKEKLIEKLEEKNQILEATTLELERFNQIASHDLKAPLRTIIGFTGLIERNLKKDNTEKALEELNFVKTSAKQMNALVEEILEISRLNNRKEAIRKSIDLNQLIERVSANLWGDINLKNAKLEIHELPIYYCNQTEFLLLFQNLIQNGLKYNKSENPLIEIWAETNEDFLSIKVKDNGIGIEEEYYEKVFDYFKRLHTNSEFKGTGLGLALCQKIVHKYQGNIGLASVVGEGSIFSVNLPLSGLGQNMNTELLSESWQQKERPLEKIKAK